MKQSSVVGRLSFVAVVAIIAMATGAFAQLSVPGWDWKLPAARFQRLSIPQRTAVTSANDLFSQGEEAMRLADHYRRHNDETRRVEHDKKAIASFRASAARWKLFGTEFVLAPASVLGYAQFMEGLSLYAARDRYAAIKILTEVIDLYEEVNDVIVPALFWRGKAYADSGDIVKATADWQVLVDTPEYESHPLYYSAMLATAEQEWARMRFDAAVARYEKLVALGEDTVPRDVLDAARTELIVWYGFQDKWDKVTPLVEAMARGNEQRRLELNWHFLNHFWHNLYYNPDWRRLYFDKLYKRSEDVEKALTKVRLGVVGWFEQQAELYVPFGDIKVWDHALQVFRYRRWIDGKRAPEMALALAKRLRDEEGLDPPTRQRRARELIDCLTQAEMFIEARSVLDYISDPVGRLWSLYTIEERSQNHEEVVRILTQLMQNNDFDTSRGAKRTLAEYYRHRINKQEEAIKLYNDLAEPPWTLWCVADSYRRMNSWDKAQNVLSELASIFPNEAAQAMWTKGEYYEYAGDRDRAISVYRQLANHPEWKQSSYAGQAHTVLREWGIDSGGGAGNDVH
ncbi:MAG: hypothetical protein FWF84_05970 [Kiritimatiellaeota bacterium]|nr:hypothetical protein [Kiritimatiellota bacterium]